ncbi:MAG TPA: hypothetical protein VGL06_20250 [Pseudonocardiaceae bacterium]
MLALLVSGTQAITWPHVAAAAAPLPAGALPPLPPGVTSTPAPPRQTAPAKPAADFGTLTTAIGKSGSHFDATKSTVVSRSMFTTEYLNPDGTHSVQESTAPLNVQDTSGAWQPVSTSLRRRAMSRTP